MVNKLSRSRRLSEVAPLDGPDQLFFDTLTLEHFEYTQEQFFKDLLSIDSQSATLVDKSMLTPSLMSQLDPDLYDAVMSEPLTSTLVRGFTLDDKNLLSLSDVRQAVLLPLEALQALSTAVVSELRSTSYIGPLRQFPSRTYSFSGAVGSDVGLAGENLPDLLFAEPPSVLAALNRLASEMELGYRVKVRRSTDEAFDKTFSIVLEETSTGTAVGINDVGFGVSQVLPILLQCVVKRSGLTLVEQPEIHLNPRLQARLGSIIARSVKRAKTGRLPSRQFVIETHSEQLLLRIGNCVKEGIIDKDDVSVLYVAKDHSGSRVHTMPLDDNGRLTRPWPDNEFFNDSFLELFGNDVDRA